MELEITKRTSSLIVQSLNAWVVRWETPHILWLIAAQKKKKIRCGSLTTFPCYNNNKKESLTSPSNNYNNKRV